ncbi:MAG TPA: hypothetical protein VFR67_08435 [Pilimelia sp.]|nr:hypothetical protein [Pilimelia sp.]
MTGSSTLPGRPAARLATRSGVAALTAVLVVVSATPALAATWSVTPTPNPLAQSNRFTGVHAQSATSAWAVGWGDTGGTPSVRPVVARWNGSAWSSVTSPSFNGDAYLFGADGDATTVWAVGQAGSRPLAERWNGSSWSVVSTPLPSGATAGQLTGVKSLAASSAWAVGSVTMPTSPGRRTLAMRWNGTSWTIVPTPNPNSIQNLLVAVDAVAANDVWAVGNWGHDGYGGDTTEGMVLRWNGSSWTNMALPAFDGTLRRTKLHDVVVLASNDVWVVGAAFSWTLFSTVPYVLHWNGQSWQQGTIPNAPTGEFHAVTALSPTKVYAAGLKNYGQTLVARWNGSTWSQESTPSPSGSNYLVDASATGTGTVWTVGSRHDSGSWTMRTLAERTTNG